MVSPFLLSNHMTREMRGVFKLIDDVDRRLAASQMTGPVAEIDGDFIRIELLPHDARTGKRFLSPWVELQEMAGATGSHFPVEIGDPVRLLSPNGEIGSQSLAIRDGYTTDHPNPTDKKQKELALVYGGCELRMSDGVMKLVAQQRVHVIAPELIHNEKSVGDTHKHGEVMPGPAPTGVPI